MVCCALQEESVYNIGVDESEENRTAVHTAEEVDPSEALFLLLDIRQIYPIIDG